MKFMKTITTFLALSMVAALVACSSGSKSTTPPPPVISVSVSGAPASLVVNGTASVTATVTNDSANAGVTWTCSPASSCGSFNPTSTASGTATTYTAPATVPSSAVTITATSVTDGTKSGTASITITAPPTTLADGSYVYSMSGIDTNVDPNTVLPNSPYFVVGQFTVSGGAITAGEQDFVDYNAVATDLIDPTASSFTANADGTLQITLTTCTGNVCPGPDTVVGVAGVETINATLVSATRARILEFDAFATSSGTLDLQDTTAAAAAPSGGYAFGIHGVDGGGNPLVSAGVLSLDGTGKLTSSSVFDQNRGGTLNPNETFDTTVSSVTGPDASGRVLISLKPTNTLLPVVNFAGYIVDATHIQLAEVTDPSGSTTGGNAFGQNASALTVVDGTTYVVGLNGATQNGDFQIAANLTLNAGNVTGFITYNDIVFFQSSSVPITAGTYVADATGRVTLTGVTDGVLTTPLNIQLYLDGNGNVTSISLDTTDVVAGVGFQQTAGAAFSGAYVMDAVGVDPTELEFNAVGPVTTGSGTFSGTVNANWFGTSAPSPDLAVTGAFTAPSGGVSTGTGNSITGLDFTTVANADSFDYYVVDANHVIAIETDSNQTTLIYFEQ